MSNIIEVLILAAGALVSLLVLAFIGYCSYLYYVHSLYAHIPGPKRDSFFLGNIPTLKRECRLGVDAYLLIDEAFADAEHKKLKPLLAEKLIEWMKEYGDTIVLFMLHTPLVFTRNPDSIRTILMTGDQHDFPKTDNILRTLSVGRFMYDGLATTMDHDAWYRRRKVLDPMFHRQQLKQAQDVFNKTGDLFIKELEKHALSGESFELVDLIHRSTLDVIMRTMFSMDNDTMYSEFHDLAINFVKESVQAFQILLGTFMYKFNPFIYQYRKHIANFISEFRVKGSAIIEQRKQMIINQSEHIPEDMLTAMIKSYLEGSDGYTYEIMLDEFNTMVLAGMETSANALCLLFMELDRRPELWKRLVDEVDEVAGSKTFISSDDASKMTFIQQLIKETLRRYPPIVRINRTIAKDTVLGGFKIPANTDLQIPTYASNMNEAVTPNAMEFDPDRFSRESDEKVPTVGFTTFSLGARSCIGQIFAQMEMRVLIAKFVQNFRFKLEDTERYFVGRRGALYPMSDLKGKLFYR